MKNVHKKAVPAFVSSEGRNGFFGYGGDSFYNLTVTMPPDTFFSTLRTPAGLAAGHALEACPVAHERELFAILARVALVALLPRFLSHGGHGQCLPLQFQFVGDTAIAGSLSVTIAAVHPIPSNRQMFGEDRGFLQRRHVDLFLVTFGILIILLHRVHP